MIAVDVIMITVVTDHYDTGNDYLVDIPHIIDHVINKLRCL